MVFDNQSLAFYPLLCNITGVDPSIPMMSPIGTMLMMAAVILTLFGLMWIMIVLTKLVLYVMTLGRYRA